jgi:integrase
MSSLPASSDSKSDAALPAVLPLSQLSKNENFPAAAFEYFQTQLHPPSRPLAFSTLKAFSTWLRSENLLLESLRAGDVARFIDNYPAEASRRRGVLSFLRGFLGFLEVRGILDRNAAASVRHIKNPYRLGGVTPALSEGDMEKLLSRPLGVEPDDLLWLRDRALIALLRESWGRIGAICRAKRSDLYWAGEGRYLRLSEKDSKVELKAIPEELSQILDDYLLAAGIGAEDEGYLFRSAKGRAQTLSDRALLPRNAYDIVSRRGALAGLPGVRPHMLRVTGLNEFRRGGGSRHAAQRKLGHASEGMVIYYERNS